MFGFIKKLITGILGFITGLLPGKKGNGYYIVFIGLHRKRFESLLPGMPAAFVMPMITTNMRRHEPLHPAAQISVLMGPQQKVEMICHQTIPSHAHRHLFLSFPHQLHKRRKVLILVEDVTAAIPPI